MTLSGSEKLPAKRLTADTSVSRIQVDGFFLLSWANNGKGLMLSGSYMDANSAELRVDLIDLDHPNVGAATLTRQ